MNSGLLIIVINVGAWLVFFIGVYIAIFRHVRRRGRVIMLSGAALAVALVATLVLALVANPMFSAPPQRPGPSDAILAATWLDSYNHTVLAGVSARDGSIRWRRSLAVSYGHTAPIANGVLYVEDGATITALRLSDGASLWHVAPSPQTGIMSSLLMRGNTLVYISVSAPYSGYDANALDVTTHARLWSVPLSDYVQDLQYPAFAASADTLFVGSSAGSVSALRLRDGKPAWTRQLIPSADYPQNLWVALGADLLYAYDAGGQIFAMRQTDGALVWREPAGLKLSGLETLTATATSLYACGNLPDDTGSALASLDPATGALRWERAGACRYNSLAESAGVLYQLGVSLSAMRASDGATLWSATTQTPDLGFTSAQSDSGVVVAAASVTYPHMFIVCPNWWSGGALFCHSKGQLAAFNGATGARYWQVTVDDQPRLLSGNGLE